MITEHFLLNSRTHSFGVQGRCMVPDTYKPKWPWSYEIQSQQKVRERQTNLADYQA